MLKEQKKTTRALRHTVFLATYIKVNEMTMKGNFEEVKVFSFKDFLLGFSLFFPFAFYFYFFLLCFVTVNICMCVYSFHPFRIIKGMKS